MAKYDHSKIEKKWQKKWEQAGVFRAIDFDPVRSRARDGVASPFGTAGAATSNGVDKKREKYYSLETFPYPSAAGLHVGHPKGYTAEDINARYQRMRGKNVLYTMGWDAFGLPTENYAIKIKKNPKEVAAANIKNFKRQVKMLGFSYDWSREINTSDPLYYKWTQWIFLQLYKKGLAYRSKAPVNWCESCKTVLANEQVKEGACERCETIVEQKEMEQWFFKITNYADELLDGLEELDWPESTKQGQKNWIGRKEGALLKFTVVGSQFTDKIEVFTTRPDTLFGATYLALAPEHSLVADLLKIKNQKSKIKNKEEVIKYIDKTKHKTQIERAAADKEKTGVELKGIKAINPATKGEIPIWVADYVLAEYGTGAIMAVPAHDERDFEFAKKYKLPIQQVVKPTYGDSIPPFAKGGIESPPAYISLGTMINSGEFNGLDNETAKWQITKAVGGKKTTQYKLRDWLVSRQRYWGAPIPIIWCEKCGAEPVSEKDLPVLLPDDVDFRPTGEPPLASSKKFRNVKCPKCGGRARRDFETMDTFVDSSWYFFRYCDADNSKTPFDFKKVKYWMPVDLYIIGAEHIALHLLYARFFTKAFRDMELIKFDEPFKKLRHVGLILGEDHRKMSKRWGNVVNPDEVVEKYGADATRLYLMFMGPLGDAAPWSTEALVGVERFLERVWQLGMRIGMRMKANKNANNDLQDISKDSQKYLHIVHKTIKKVTEDIEAMKFNTAIAAMMTLTNELSSQSLVHSSQYEILLKLLHPFAPHITEELNERICQMSNVKCQMLARQTWPKYNPELVKNEEIELVIQINGKVRDTIKVNTDIKEDEAKELVLKSEKINKWITGQEIKKVVFVKGKLINIVL